MEVYAEAAGHAFEAQPVALQANTFVLTETETVEPSLASEPGETRAVAISNSAIEPAVRVVQTFQRRTLQSRWKHGSLRVGSPPFGKCQGLIKIGSFDPTQSIGIDAFLKRGVVQLALRLQNALQSPMLAALWQ